MNWEMLDQLLASTAHATTATRADPSATLRELERVADGDPGHRLYASAIRALEGAATATPLAGTDRAGYRRGDLLAWDPWSLTWRARDLETGADAVLRELRPDAETPVRRRALARDAMALAPLVDGLRSGEGWVAAPLLGDVLPPQPADRTETVARIAGTALHALRRFEQAGLWPVTAPEQWRLVDGNVRIVALDLTHRTDPGPVIAQLMAFLLPTGAEDTPILNALDALRQAPPTTVADAIDTVERALATDLAARRHDVFDRRRREARSHRLARLLDIVERLAQARPPPLGRGAMGVDLEGRTLIAEGRPEGVWWGLEGELGPLWTPEEGFDAPAARRLLRTRASAPPSERLNREVDGDPTTADRLGRWVAAALKARTVRLLLEKDVETTVRTER